MLWQQIWALVLVLQSAVGTLTAQVQQILVGGVGWVSVKNYGAKGNGIADDTAAIQRALNATAGTNIVLWFPSGTYPISLTVTIPDGVDIKADPGAVFVGSITTIPTSTAMFYAPVPAAVGATTLQANVVAGQPTVSLTALPTGLQVKTYSAAQPGPYVQIASVASSPLSGIYQVLKVTGAGPYTVTLDRAVLWPFVVGDTFNVLSSKPSTMYWSGGTFTGQCAGFFTGCYWFSIKEKMLFRSLTGNNMDVIAGFLYGSYCNVMRNMRADCSTGGTALNAGFASESELAGMEDCVIENGAPGSSFAAFKYADARNCWDFNCAANNAQYGLVFGTDSGTTVGSQFCRSVGGQFNNCTTNGIYIGAGSSYNTIESAACNNNTGAGVVLDGTGSMTANRFAKLTCNSNGAQGVSVQAGATSTRFDSLTTDSNTGVGLLVAAATSVGHHRCITSSASAGACLSVGAECDVEAEDYAVTGSASAVQITAAVRLTMGKGRILVGTNGTAILSSTASGVAILEGVRCAPNGAATGTTGFSATAGTIRIGSGCDAGACATPLNVAGGYCNCKQTVVANGTTNVAIAWPDAKTTDVLQFTLQSVGGTFGDPKYTITAGTGYTFTSTSATDTSTYEYYVP